ncbi:unnamed protein product [Pedinophyceae sp. YPF-701]|nr:unnamed protein product [Pedinophyceae sp. YPF-701]
MFCAVSGSVPEDPVVSKKTGHLFERRLVVKHIADTGRCPVTNEELSEDDLLPVRSNKALKPRTTNATSIPGLLALFQSEWDAVMLDAHQLRQQLHTVRQELSHALYQHDAACRVIARLMRERDEAREMLTSARADDGEARPAKRAKAGIPQSALDDVQATCAQLSSERKKRGKGLPEGLRAAADLAKLSLQDSHPVHKAAKGGINSVAICAAAPDAVITSGADSTAQVFDRAAGKVHALKGHTKRVNQAAFAGSDVAVSCSADKTAKVWRKGKAWSCVETFTGHGAEVTGVAVHPGNKYCVTAAKDAKWAFHDLTAGITLTEVANPSEESPELASVQFHPDGALLGTGSQSGLVQIWDVNTQKVVAKFEHAGPVHTLAFSENGYQLATAAGDAVKIWDLRKLKSTHSLDVPGVRSVAFDGAAAYLGVVTPTAVQIHGVKQAFEMQHEITEHADKGPTCLAFGPLAQWVAVGGSDHKLRIFG